MAQKPTKDQIARAVEVLRKEGIDTAEKFEALLKISEKRQASKLTLVPIDSAPRSVIRTHAYEKDSQSGAGNCICGANEHHRRHPHEYMQARGFDHCVCALPKNAPQHGGTNT